MNKIWLLLGIALLGAQAEATQKFNVKNGDTIMVEVSAKDLTRIAVDGSGKLADIKVAAGILEIEPDLDRGDLHIRPLPGAPATFSFFLTDDLGSTYTIVAQQSDVPSETVLLRIDNSRRDKDGVQDSEKKTIPYVESIKQLIKAMALNVTPDGYAFDEVNKKVPVWKETSITLTQLYTGYDLLGEVYVLQNLTKEQMTFNEKEFFEFGENVRAVGLDKLSLEAGETTHVYVVRAKGVN